MFNQIFPTRENVLIELVTIEEPKPLIYMESNKKIDTYIIGKIISVGEFVSAKLEVGSNVIISKLAPIKLTDQLYMVHEDAIIATWI